MTEKKKTAFPSWEKKGDGSVLTYMWTCVRKYVRTCACAVDEREYGTCVQACVQASGAEATDDLASGLTPRASNGGMPRASNGTNGAGPVRNNHWHSSHAYAIIFFLLLCLFFFLPLLSLLSLLLLPGLSTTQRLSSHITTMVSFLFLKNEEGVHRSTCTSYIPSAPCCSIPGTPCRFVPRVHYAVL